MPRRLDHDQRRAQIAHAVWSIIVHDGVSAVSLRTVAAEAGLAVGSLRHSFPTKEELLAFSMELVHARVRDRVRSHGGLRDPRALALAMLLETLPLDGERRTEMRVNLALVVESPAHPRLDELAREAQDAIAAMCGDLCRHLRDAGVLHSSRDVQAEGKTMHALIDGLALHLTVEPRGAQAAITLIERHIAALATPAVSDRL